MIGPKIYLVPRELSAIVCKQVSGHPALPDETIKNLDHMFTLQTLPDFDGNAFAAEHVFNGNGPELLSGTEMVVDKVEAPRFVGSRWPTASLPVNDHLPATWSFSP